MIALCQVGRAEVGYQQEPSYFELLKPKPLSIAAKQELLRPNEVLVQFLDTWTVCKYQMLHPDEKSCAATRWWQIATTTSRILDRAPFATRLWSRLYHSYPRN